MKKVYSIVIAQLLNLCLNGLLMHINRVFFIKIPNQSKKAQQSNIFLFVAVFFMIILVNSTPYAHATEKNTNEQNIEDEITVLDLENQTLLPKKIEGFITVKNTYKQLYDNVEEQMPENAYLLDVYVPDTYKASLSREMYENITLMVYLYTMPPVLEEKRLYKMQLAFIKQALKSAFVESKLLASPTLDTKIEWENTVYDLFKAGQSIYFEKPKKEENAKSTVLQIFPMGEERYTGAFLSTYVFIRNRQIYFLSASTFLVGNNYYDEFMWTSDVLDTFIKLLPEEEKEIIK